MGEGTELGRRRGPRVHPRRILLAALTSQPAPEVTQDFPPSQRPQPLTPAILHTPRALAATPRVRVHPPPLSLKGAPLPPSHHATFCLPTRILQRLGWRMEKVPASSRSESPGSATSVFAPTHQPRNIPQLCPTCKGSVSAF